MKKQLLLIIISIVFSLNTVKAQSLNFSSLFAYPNDTFKLFATAVFGYGTFGGCCPPLIAYDIQSTGDTMHVKLFYQSIFCVTDFCETDSLIGLGQVTPNTLKVVKLHPYTIGLVSSPPPVWDTTYYSLYEKVLLFPWTGINDISKKHFSVSPNPATSEFTIQYAFPGEATLTDINGSVINRYTLPAGKKETTININQLANGLYLLQYKTETINEILKIVKSE